MVEILGWNHPSLKIPEAPIPCMMFSFTSYEQEFPSLDRKTYPGDYFQERSNAPEFSDQ